MARNSSIFRKIFVLLIVTCVLQQVIVFGWFSSQSPIIGIAYANPDGSGNGNSGNSGDSGNSGSSGSSGSSGNSGSNDNSGNSKNSISGTNENSAAGKSNENQQGTNDQVVSSAEGKNEENSPSSASQQGQITATPLGIQGSETRSKDTGKEISIDTKIAKDAGETITVDKTSINFAKGPVTISVETKADPHEEEGKITADIKSITLKNSPTTASVKDTGTVSASFEANLVDLPPADATVAATISRTPDPVVLAAYQEAVAKQGDQMGDVAYAMTVAKTNLADGKDIGAATVKMSVPVAWVEDRGGAGAVKIARYADDGSTQVLDTTFIGLDSSSNMVFEGASQGGLSIFALITVRTNEETITPRSSTSESLPIPEILYTFTGISILLFIVILLIRKR